MSHNHKCTVAKICWNCLYAARPDTDQPSDIECTYNPPTVSFVEAADNWLKLSGFPVMDHHAKCRMWKPRVRGTRGVDYTREYEGVEIMNREPSSN